MKTTFKTKVFKRAYEIMKNTGKAFAVCLSKAWALFRLVKKMRLGIVQFTFEKKDATLRRASGVLKAATTSTSKRRKNFKTVAYLGIEKQGFRCFKVENLITVI